MPLILLGNDPAGTISGGLKFNSTTIPPYITSGEYEVNRITNRFSADQAIATTDVLDQSSISLETYCHYLVCLNRSGSKKIVLNYEGLVATGNVASITGGSTTKTLAKSSGTFSGSNANKILVISGNSTFNGVFKIATDNGTVLTFEGATTTVGGATGTWTIYERISTLHVSGSNTAITNDGDISRYTPSYGENGWSAGAAAWDDTKQGFYLTGTGYTDYRVLGNFYTDGSANISKDIISHKSRRNKNDNFLRVNDYSSKVSQVIRWAKFTLLRGSDYLFTDDGTNGSIITIKNSCEYFIVVKGQLEPGIQTSRYLTVNSTTYDLTDDDNVSVSYGAAGLGSVFVLSLNRFGSIDDIIRLAVDNNPTVTDRDMLEMLLVR